MDLFSECWQSTLFQILFFQREAVCNNSFVVLFQIIARVSADPEDLPRCVDFGLNVDLFHKKFCQNCPEPLLMLAVLCSQLEPDKR